MHASTQSCIIDELKTLNLSLQQTLQTQQAAIQSKDKEISLLLEQLHLLRHKHFGRSTEQATDQIALAFNEAEAVAATPDSVTDDNPIKPSRRKPGSGRIALPKNLPRIIEEHDLPEHEKICPNDGQPLHRIGTQESEQLDIIPMQVRVIRHIRHQYACRCCGDIVKVAPLAPQPLPKTIAAASTAALVVTNKYCDHIPLYRQEGIFARHNIPVSRATLADWVIKLSQVVIPLLNLCEEKLLAGRFMQMDETPLQVLAETGRAATSKSYMWVRRGGPPDQPIILFHYAPSRSSETALQLTQDFQGYLQTDGYGVYDTIAAQAGIHHVGCMAHARRKFMDVLEALPKKHRNGTVAAEAIEHIKQLYAIEAQCQNAQAPDRYHLRQAQSLPHLNDFKRWLDQKITRVPPASLLGKALYYLKSQWPKLIRYTEDGHIPIDNNLIENAIRPFALGRKNWLFSATPNGAHASARLYSLIETAKANHHEPYHYLRHVFKELPKATTLEHIEALLPWNLDPVILRNAP